MLLYKEYTHTRTHTHICSLGCLHPRSRAIQIKCLVPVVLVAGTRIQPSSEFSSSMARIQFRWGARNLRKG